MANEPAKRPRDLPALASEINAEHEAAERAINDSLAHARRCGELLIEAKRRCGHGRFGAWLVDNFHASHRTANGYMRIARRWAELPANSQGLANLGIEEALAELASPREPEPEPGMAAERRPMSEDEARAIQEQAERDDWRDAWGDLLLRLAPAPAPDRVLSGRSGDWRALIEPSGRKADGGPFYYVTVFGPDLDFVHGTKKPVPADLAAFYLHSEQPEGHFELEGSSWTILPAPADAPRFNRWLFDSHEDYIQRAVLGRNGGDDGEA